MGAVFSLAIRHLKNTYYYVIINYRGGPHVPRAVVMTTNKQVKVRFLIGVQWDGREQLFVQKFIANAAQFCIDRAWRRIDGVDFQAHRFTVYENPYPVITGVNWEADCEDWEKEYERSKSDDDYF